MFTFDDSKVFTTCQQEPKGVSIVDVSGRKEIKFIPIKGGRAGGMTVDGKYFLASAKNAVVVIDTSTNEIHKTIKVPVGGGNFTCLPDGSKCYVGLRKDNSVGVIDMASLELIKTIKMAFFFFELLVVLRGANSAIYCTSKICNIGSF